VGALALPPVFLFPCILVSYAYLCYAIWQAVTPRQAFWLSWWWGLGYFLAGLYWICISLTVDLVRFGWMIPFALFGLNGLFALFPAIAGYVGKRYAASGKRFGRILQSGIGYALPVLLVFLSEWLRGHILTGFPWNLAGYSWLALDGLARWFAWIGIYPLTAVTLILSACLAYGAWQRKWRWCVSAVAIPIICWGIGVTAPYSKNPTIPLRARMIQANIPQSLKWDEAFQLEALRKHIALSRLEGQEEADVILWPESSYPYVIQLDQPVPPILTEWLLPHQRLIFGAVTADNDRKAYYNSVVQITPDGVIESVYHKHHLVPFGEYVPLRQWLPLDRIAPGSVDFTEAGSVLPMRISTEVVAQPLICYESIFPDYSNSPESQLLINVTNDAWFGHSSGPYQHLQMARARAIEQQKPMLRVANTGISAVIDAHGNILEWLPLNTSGVIDVDLRRNETLTRSIQD